MKKVVPFKPRGVIHKKLRAAFGALEVVEATMPLRLQPMPCDVEGATVKDPTNCVFARTAHRQYGATMVIFWKSVAYVDLVGADGVRRVERFIVPAATLDLIEKFDRGEPFAEGRAFELLPPPLGKTRAHKNAKNAKNRKLPKVRAKRKVARLTRTVIDQRAKLEQTEERLREIRATEKPNSPKVKLAAARVKDASTRLKETTKKVVKASKAIGVTPKLEWGDGLETRKFDLSVRNGQAHYNITPAE